MLSYFRCSSVESRTAAYEVLAELANGCLKNLELICNELVSMHHLADPDLANEWDVSNVRVP